ncbi:MAG: hypothetical protein EOO61_02995 [Hymenobacter sp.]|nr:MAG: hypothetical protein EOO61_02995 [Hymenobacter sp.]
MAQLLTFANFNDFHRHNVRYMKAHFYVFFHVFKLIERLEKKEEGVYNAYNITDDNGHTIIAILVGGAYYLYSAGWTPEMLKLLASQVDVAKCKAGFQFLGQRDLIAELLNKHHAKWQVVKDRLIYTCQQVTNQPEKSRAVVQNATLHDVHRLIELTIDYDKEEYPAKLKRDEAKAYAELPKPEISNPRLAAMKHLFDGKQKLFITANAEKDIRLAVDFAKKYGIVPVIKGGEEAHLITSFLKENDIAVIIKQPHSLPSNNDDDVNLPYKRAGILDNAGINVVISIDDYWQQRNLPFMAGTAVAWGVDREKALQMITLNTAKILGIDQSAGSLEMGKDATFFISEGDALDMKTNKVETAFIQGRNINLDNLHKQLDRKFSDKYGQGKK